MQLRRKGFYQLNIPCYKEKFFFKVEIDIKFEGIQ